MASNVHRADVRTNFVGFEVIPGLKRATYERRIAVCRSRQSCRRPHADRFAARERGQASARACHIDGDLTIEYGQFVDHAQRLAARFADLGVNPGDRIVLHLGHCHQAAIACYAAMMLGAITVPLNVHLKAHELARLMRRLQPALYIGHLARCETMNDVPPDLLPFDRRFYLDRVYIDMPRTPSTVAHDHAGSSWEALMASARGTHPLPPPDRDAIAVLLCTSGTTGEPKLVAHTQLSFAQAIDYLK